MMIRDKKIKEDKRERERERRERYRKVNENG